MLVAEPDSPVGELALTLAGGKPLSLPRGIIGVVNVERRWRRAVAARLPPIEGGELVEQDAERQAIDDDVVGAQQQRVAFIAEARDRCSKKRAHGQVERDGQRLSASARPGPPRARRRRADRRDAARMPAGDGRSARRRCRRPRTSCVAPRDGRRRNPARGLRHQRRARRSGGSIQRPNRRCSPRSICQRNQRRACACDSASRVRGTGTMGEAPSKVRQRVEM